MANEVLAAVLSQAAFGALTLMVIAYSTMVGTPPTTNQTSTSRCVSPQHDARIRWASIAAGVERRTTSTPAPARV